VKTTPLFCLQRNDSLAINPCRARQLVFD
jgi:hypothetical protein